MKLRHVFLIPVVTLALAAGRLLADDPQPTNGTATTAAVYVPDMTHAAEPMPDGVLAWDSFFHLRPDDQRQMFGVFARHAAPSAVLMFNSGPVYSESVGTYRGAPLSLQPESRRI